MLLFNTLGEQFAPPLTSVTSPPTNTNMNLSNASSPVHSSTYMQPSSSSQRHPLLGHTSSSSSSSPPDSSNNSNNHNHTDDNISNSSYSDREAEKYIVKLRLCTLVDIFGLFYRSVLTMPGWFAYFSLASVGATPFSCLYLGCKALDLCVKGYGGTFLLRNNFHVYTLLLQRLPNILYVFGYILSSSG